MNRRFGSVSFGQPLDHLFYVLHVFCGAHHHGISGLDHDQIIDADRCHQPVLTPHIAIASVLQEDVALRHIPVSIACPDLPQRRPGPDIAPTAVQFDHAAL